MAFPPETAVEAISLPDRHDQFVHMTVTEQSDPALVAFALRIHATGYQDAGFVNEDAITPEGFLVPELDKSRGPTAEYFLALPKRLDGATKGATMRKYSLPPGGTYRNLPAYGMCAGALTPASHTYLAELDAPDVRLKEIAALAGTPLGIYEVMRKAIQEALGKNEVWLFNMVSNTHVALSRSLGESNLVVMGSEVAIDDSRVAQGLTLVPAIFLPDRFIDNLLVEYRRADSMPAQKALLRSFLFFTDGLIEGQMSQEAYAARRELSQGVGARSA